LHQVTTKAAHRFILCAYRGFSCQKNRPLSREAAR